MRDGHSRTDVCWRVLPRKSAGCEGRGPDRFSSTTQAIRKPGTPMTKAVSQTTPGPVGVVCAQMRAGNLPTGREPTRHEAPVPKLLGMGTYRAPLHFGPVRDGHQPMSSRSPQPVSGCAACSSGFSLLMQGRLSSAQAISKFQKGRTRSISRTYRPCQLTSPAKQPSQNREVGLGDEMPTGVKADDRCFAAVGCHHSSARFMGGQREFWEKNPSMVLPSPAGWKTPDGAVPVGRCWEFDRLENLPCDPRTMSSGFSGDPMEAWAVLGAVCPTTPGHTTASPLLDVRSVRQPRGPKYGP
jgi:hypothetical protein